MLWTSHLHDYAYRARFTTIVKNIWDAMCRQMAFNLFREAKILGTVEVRGEVSPEDRKRTDSY